jgi:hypothetical protein
VRGDSLTAAAPGRRLRRSPRRSSWRRGAGVCGAAAWTAASFWLHTALLTVARVWVEGAQHAGDAAAVNAGLQ